MILLSIRFATLRRQSFWWDCVSFYCLLCGLGGILMGGQVGGNWGIPRRWFESESNHLRIIIYVKVKQLNNGSNRLKAVLKGFTTVKFLWLLVHQLLLRRCLAHSVAHLTKIVTDCHEARFGRIRERCSNGKCLSFVGLISSFQNFGTIQTGEFSFEGEPKKMEQFETELKSVLWYLWMELWTPRSKRVSFSEDPKKSAVKAGWFLKAVVPYTKSVMVIWKETISFRVRKYSEIWIRIRSCISIIVSQPRRRCMSNCDTQI